MADVKTYMQRADEAGLSVRTKEKLFDFALMEIADLRAALQAQQGDALDAECYRWLMSHPQWTMRWRIHTKTRVEQWQMRDDGEPWGQWGDHRAVLRAAMLAARREG